MSCSGKQKILQRGILCTYGAISPHGKGQLITTVITPTYNFNISSQPLHTRQLKTLTFDVLGGFGTLQPLEQQDKDLSHIL